MEADFRRLDRDPAVHIRIPDKQPHFPECPLRTGNRHDTDRRIPDRISENSDRKNHIYCTEPFLFSCRLTVWRRNRNKNASLPTPRHRRRNRPQNFRYAARLLFFSAHFPRLRPLQRPCQDRFRNPSFRKKNRDFSLRLP